MKPNESVIEIRVGIFVMVGMGLVMASVLFLGGKESIFNIHYHYHTHFPRVDGLVGGAKVVLGGLQIGTVKRVDFDDAARDIVVDFSIEKKYSQWLRKDSSTVEIVTQGVLGDKYLSINAGDPSQPLIENNGEVPVGASKDLSQLLTSSEQLMNKLTLTADDLERVLASFNRNNRADQFFSGLAATSKNLSDMSAKINDQVSKAEIKSAINHLNSILDKVDRGQGTLGALINDPGLYDDAKALVGQTNRNRIMRNLIRQTIKDNQDKAPATKQ